MKRLPFIEISVVVLSLFVAATVVLAQTEQTQSGPPPIAQPLVREGDFAVKLVFALALGVTEDEVEAESLLGEVGIAPRNGWIADYPVTPDILGELQQAVADATDSKRLLKSKDEALKGFQEVVAEFDLTVRPYSGETREAEPSESEQYPNPTVINNYYYSQGPPVITYYPPPPSYYYMYTWVPYPFWWFDFWFPGFFILHDFHKVVIINKRAFFITNHFNDFRVHRVFRIDPVDRFRGRTFRGIGVRRSRDFISSGVPRGADRRIFNRPVERVMPRGRAIVPPGREQRIIQPPSREQRIIRPPSRGERMGAPPSRERMISPPSRGGTVAPPSGGGRGPVERRGR